MYDATLKDMPHSDVWHDYKYVWVRDMYGTCSHLCQYHISCNMYMSSWHICMSSWRVWHVQTLVQMPNVTQYLVICLIQMRDTTHSCVRHDSFLRTHICVNASIYMFLHVYWGTWLVHVCDMTYSYVGHDSCMHGTWLTLVCNVTHSCVWHDSCMCGHDSSMCPVTHSCVCHASCMRWAWLTYVCDMTHSYAFLRTLSCMCVNICMHLYTYAYPIYTHMGWLWLVGSIGL